ncbi:LiaI-LiaF-like domain-containing protein [Clostridium sp. MT-14]|jgi:cytochrome c oxidase subunit IV|uniref:DUF5668 domain-containing protein n=1 Tax=Clostridium aromativorans TaxID=2836848 RepID=A0ABS8N8I2_9CLOT|nr:MULTISPECIES: DUF5668 domain-containing protein [Clostridium]KAA8667330.1 hypothetical protein F3O63_15830 [Clostridium sp. HV4-5-A1G]MCC9296117.1 DUF5668 domain-containing protein [Clostridium aromativorans]CAB1246346.1 conserved membrane hypothetical protein [Clostridiaceae bacterium BL-3]
MIRGRRVGTLTSGIMLVIFGTMFLISSLFKMIDYRFIMSFWPVILISIGIEIIVSYIINKKEKMMYDAGAIIIVIVLCIFAMIMGALQLAITSYPQFRVVF